MTAFTRILVNPQKRGGRALLTNPQAMHAAVLACFPPDLDTTIGRVLWRVDHRDDEHVLYIVSPEQPDASVIVDQAGWPTRPGEIADYSPLLDSLRTGHERAFRLTANPVRSLPTNGGKRGKVVPHVTPAQQIGWLIEKAQHHGFEIRPRVSPVDLPEAQPEASGAAGVAGAAVLSEGTGSTGGTGGTGGEEIALEPDVAVTRRDDLSFGRRERDSGRKGRVALRTAQFDGTLRVTDAELFRQTLTQGIGRGRAYGCGLITLARIPT